MNTIKDINQILMQNDKFKVIIVLYGKEKCGKTLTLAQVHNYFTNVKLNNKTRFVINDNKNTIVICTAGDNERTIVSNINFATKHKADIFVTAARISKTSGDKMLNTINSFVKQVRGCCTLMQFINKEELNQRLNKSLKTTNTQIINADVANQIANILKQLEQI